MDKVSNPDLVQNSNDTNKTVSGSEVDHLMSNLHFGAKEAYNLLRTNILFTLPEKSECKVIGVTSAIRGEGKSTTSINLAYTLAENGLRVLLIDTDLRLPSVAKKLGCVSNLGFSDYLIGAVSLENVIRKLNISRNLRIIFSGSIPPNPSELLGSKAAKDKINELKQMFDYIILDLPPVNIVTDALVAKDLTDGVLVVVREGYSDRKSVDGCVRQLQFLQINVLGFVLTDSTGADKSYSKYHSRNYKYGKSYYGYGYGQEKRSKQ